MADSSTAVCTFADLEVHFGGVTALNGVGGELLANEVVAVIGPNGAGKTTFLNVLSGFAVPSRGHIDYRGEPLLELRPHDRSGLGIARSFQFPALLEDESAIDNIVSGAHTRLTYGPGAQLARRGVVAAGEAGARRTAGRLLEEFDLAEFGDVPVSELSFGIRKLVDVLRAVIQEPNLLLLDEPTAGMSSEERVRVERIIAQLRIRPITIVVVEHHMSVVRAVADRVMTFGTGSILNVEQVAPGSAEAG